MNSLADLNEYLFGALDALTNDDLTDEQLQHEINRSQAITKVAETVIRNGELALRTVQTLNEYGYTTDNVDEVPVPEMLKFNGRKGSDNLLGGGALTNGASLHTRTARLYRGEYQRQALRRAG